MMELDGLHLLLTWSCTFECDHCFVFGSPRQSGTMTLSRIRAILDQASSVEWIYFEGGEPFLFHGLLVAAVREAAERGHSVACTRRRVTVTARGRTWRGQRSWIPSARPERLRRRDFDFWELKQRQTGQNER